MSRRERQTYRMAARDFSGPAVEEQPTAAEAKILFCQCLFISQPMFNFAPESLDCKLSFPIHAGHRWTERVNVSVSRPRIDSSKSCRRRGEKWHRQHRSGCPINLALHRYLVRVKSVAAIVQPKQDEASFSSLTIAGRRRSGITVETTLQKKQNDADEGGKQTCLLTYTRSGFQGQIGILPFVFWQ